MRRPVIAVLLLFIFMISCSKDEEVMADYNVTVGEVFELSMYQPGIAGGPWVWVKNKTSIIDSVGFTSILSSQQPGASAIVIWKLKGKKAGTETLNFVFGDNTPNKLTRKFVVNVIQL